MLQEKGMLAKVVHFEVIRRKQKWVKHQRCEESMNAYVDGRNGNETLEAEDSEEKEEAEKEPYEEGNCKMRHQRSRKRE